MNSFVNTVPSSYLSSFQLNENIENIEPSRQNQPVDNKNQTIGHKRESREFIFYEPSPTKDSIDKFESEPEEAQRPRRVTSREEPFLLQVSPEEEFVMNESKKVSVCLIGKIWNEKAEEREDLCIRRGFPLEVKKGLPDGPKFVLRSEQPIDCTIYATTESHQYEYRFPCEVKTITEINSDSADAGGETDRTEKLIYKFVDVALSRLDRTVVEHKPSSGESSSKTRQFGSDKDLIHFHVESIDTGEDVCLTKLGSYIVRNVRKVNDKILKQPENFTPFLQKNDVLPRCLQNATDFSNYLDGKSLKTIPSDVVKQIKEELGIEFLTSWIADSLRDKEPNFPSYKERIEKVISNFDLLASSSKDKWIKSTNNQNLIGSEQHNVIDPLREDNPFRNVMIDIGNAKAGADANRILMGDARMFTHHKKIMTSPAEAWFKGGASLMTVRIAISTNLQYFINNNTKRLPNITPQRLRNSMRKQFAPTGQYLAADTLAIMDQIEKHFEVTFKTILDPCAGYFGRGIGFMSLGRGPNSRDGVVYVGVDPNKAIPYNNAIQVLKEHTSAKAAVINLPFEDQETLDEISEQLTSFGIENEKSSNAFDYAFTSPPFFDIEHYSDDDTQSSVRYPIYDDWKMNFFYPMLDRVNYCLKPGGIFAIHIKGEKGHPICDDMNKYIMENSELEYEGAILQKTTRRGTEHIKGTVVDFVWVYRKKPLVSSDYCEAR